MLSLILFALFIVLGYYLNSKDKDLLNKDILHKATWYNLLLVVLFQFWTNGLEVSYLYLIAIGFAIHLLPISIALLLNSSNYNWKKYFLAYSTFGGGNRGVLALTLIAPDMLPYFFIFDIGIFLSLLLVYPTVSKLLSDRQSGGKSLISISSFLPVAVTSGMITLGVCLQHFTIANDFPSIVFPYLKISLLVLVSLYLGINFVFSLRATISDITKALVVRISGVFIPAAILCYILLPETEFSLALALIGLAVFLPVSSLAPQLTQTATLREWVAGQVVVSSVSYVAILFFASIFMMIYA